MTLLWHYYWIHYNIHYDTWDYYDTIITLLKHYYPSIMTLLWPYYDCIITPLWLYYHSIMTLLWQYYTYYDGISAPHLPECADSSLLPEHGEMIINRPWSLELDFNQQVGAQLSWEAAGVPQWVVVRYYYTHYLFHYTVYGRCLNRIAAALRRSYALQICRWQFGVSLQVEEAPSKL